MIICTQDGTHIPKAYLTIKHTILMTLLSYADENVKSTCYSQASKILHWRSIMTDEFNAFIQNGKQVLTLPPSNRQIMSCKWIFKIKRKSNESIERYEARLAIKGYNQQERIDHTDTFNPIIKHTTIHIVLSLVVLRGQPVKQLNVNNVFLHGQLDEEIYMHQPPSFVDDQFSNYVCLFKKSIYGLKQAPCAWFHHLNSYLIEIGFTGSKMDTPLFIYHKEGATIYLLISDDNILITSKKPNTILSFISKHRSKFAIKDLGPLHYFLGVEVTSSGYVSNVDTNGDPRVQNPEKKRYHIHKLYEKRCK